MKYDYIIVGGGSAGCVVASRLSEDTDRQVLLIEAGSDTLPDLVPEMIADSYPGLAYFHPDYHWTDLRIHTTSSVKAGKVQKPQKFEQAKVMGGGSSINGQMAIRGLPWDFDDWKAAGLDGWSAEDVMPFFRKLERDLDFDGPEHGNTGPIPIRRLPHELWPGLSRAVEGAMIDKGYPRGDDLNGSTEDGIFPIPINNEHNRRVSAATGYLTNRVRRRPNLTILANTTVNRLVFEGRRIVGVEVQDSPRAGGSERRRYDASEVIISSGALHTPALLMRSGIGPGAHLREKGIEVVADLPGVGQNLLEHPSVSFALHLRPEARLPDAIRRQIFMGLRYSSGLEGCTKGDMLLLTTNKAGWHPVGRRMGAFLVAVNKSYSQGQVLLQGNNVSSEPFVELRLASDPRDLKRLIEGAKRLMGLLDSPQMKAAVNFWFPSGYSDATRALAVKTPLNAIKTWIAAQATERPGPLRDYILHKKMNPSVDVERLKKDEDYLADWVRNTVWPNWHVSGTCKMGADSDPMAVLDAQCRVRGVDGLRVVDASVMPSIVSANTNISTIMIGERASSLIRNLG